MHWDGPILTDSGGYQVMSLAKLRRIDEQGVTFQSHIDGATVELTPERAIEVQCLLGSDIQMVLDECTPYPATRDEAQVPRSSCRSAGRSAARTPLRELASRARPCSASCRAASIRICAKRCASALIEIGFDGYAIGGLAVGEGQGAMLDMVETTAAVLPEDRPRYLMGVGTPEDLLASIARGIDMFDCVMPTRSGRHCQAFYLGRTAQSRVMRAMPRTRARSMRKAHARRRATERAYLHHLVKSGRCLGPCCSLAPTCSSTRS